MSLENGRISNLQLAMLVAGFTLGSSLLLTPGGSVGNSAWLAIIAGLAEAAVFVGIFVYLAHRFQSFNLIEINAMVFGKIGGWLISAMYLWYFFHLCSLVIRNFIDFLSIAAMPGTPSIIFALFIVLTCSWALKRGLEPLARSAQVLLVLTVLIFLFLFIMLINRMNPENLLPVMDTPINKFLAASHGAATFPFAETVVFLMVFPFVEKKDVLWKTVFGALFFAAGYLVVASIRSISILGESLPLYTYPAFETARLLNVAQVVSRLEILIGLNFLMMGFLKISILYYALVLGSSQLLGLRSYQPLVLPVGIILVVFSLFTLRNLPENIYFAQVIYPIYALPFQLILPLLTLIIAILRKLPGRKK